MVRDRARIPALITPSTREPARTFPGIFDFDTSDRGGEDDGVEGIVEEGLHDFLLGLTGQYSKKSPQVEGLPVVLSKRHAKIRREGYRR
jgi:hypothetical protein